MSMRILLCILVLGTGVHAERYALLVANSFAGSRFEQLKYTENDIDNMEKALTGFCGFEKSRIIRLVNESPKELDSEISDLKAMCGRDTQDDLILFYYSGHAQEGRLLMGDEEYDLARLRSHLKDFPASMRIGILDACQSGSYARLKGGKLAEPFLFEPLDKTQGEVLLYSSSTTESSQESDAYQGSVFTFHFVNALRGCGDLSGDGKVTLTEAYQYSYNQTVASTIHSSGGPQHPGYRFNIQGEGDVVLADIQIRTSGILLESDLQGGITILDKSRNVIAELGKEKASRVMVALNPGLYTLVNHRDDSVYDAAVRIEEGRVVSIAARSLTPARSRKSYAKGAPQPFRGVHLKLRGGYRLLDFAELDRQVDAQFDGYRYFGIQPNIHLPNEWNEGGWAIGGELCISTKHGIAGFGGFDYLRTTGDQRYPVSRINPVDGIRYGGSFRCIDTLRMLSWRMGSGYFLNRTILKGLGITAGAEMLYISLFVSSSLADSLFDIEASGSDKYKNALPVVVPFAGLSYSYRLWRNVSAGIDLRFRFRKKPVVLQEENSYYYTDAYYPAAEESNTVFSCRVGGLDALAFVMVSFGPGWR